MDIQKTWEDLIRQMKSDPAISDSMIDAFFSRTQLQAVSMGFAMFTTENKFIKSFVESRFSRDIKKAFKALYGTDFEVLFEVDETLETKPLTYTPSMAAAEEPVEEKPQAATQVASAPQNEAPAASTPKAPTQSQGNSNGENSINSNFTFENYVQGESNRMAYSMAVEVAEMPGMESFNPFFVYGKSGVGKTHLLLAIKNYINRQYPEMYVIYTDAMEMVRRYSEASIDKSIEKDSFRKFNDYYNEADVLIIDDVQGLQGKRETLTAVFQIFNKLTNMGKQVVLAADRAPKNIDLEERYVSRFNSGTTIDIQPPDTETKRNIALGYLLQLEEERGGEKIAISDDILDYLAENSSSNIRELKSAITRLVFEIRNSPEGEISLTKAKEILSNHFINDTTVRITPDIIFGAVESFFKVSHTEILGKKRTRSIVHPRQIAIYLIREMTDLTYLDIAKIMGKDHSTIIHSYNLIDEKLAENREVFEEIEAIKELIKSREF